MMMKIRDFLFYGTIYTMVLTVISTSHSVASEAPSTPDADKRFKEDPMFQTFMGKLKQKATVTEMESKTMDEIFGSAGELELTQKDYDCDLVEKLLTVTRGMYAHYNAIMKMKDQIAKIKTKNSTWFWRRDYKNSVFNDEEYALCLKRIKKRTGKIQQLLKAFNHVEQYKDDGAYVKTGKIVWETTKFIVKLGAVIATGCYFGANPQATWDEKKEVFGRPEGWIHTRQAIFRTANAFLPVITKTVPVVSELMHGMGMYGPYNAAVKMDNKLCGCTTSPEAGLKTLIDSLQQTHLRCQTNELNDQERMRLWKTAYFVQKVIMNEHTLPSNGQRIVPHAICNNHDYLWGGKVGAHRTYVKRFVFVAIPKTTTVKGFGDNKTTEKITKLHHDTMEAASKIKLGAHYIAMHAQTKQNTLDRFQVGTMAKVIRSTEYPKLKNKFVYIEKDEADYVVVYEPNGKRLKKYFKLRYKRYTLKKTDLESLNPDTKTYKSNSIVGVVQLKYFKQLWIQGARQGWHSWKGKKVRNFLEVFTDKYDLTLYNIGNTEGKLIKGHQVTGRWKEKGKECLEKVTIQSEIDANNNVKVLLKDGRTSKTLNKAQLVPSAFLATRDWQDVPAISKHITGQIKNDVADIKNVEYLKTLDVHIERKHGKKPTAVRPNNSPTEAELKQQKKAAFNSYNEKKDAMITKLYNHIGNWNRVFMLKKSNGGEAAMRELNLESTHRVSGVTLSGTVHVQTGKEEEKYDIMERQKSKVTVFNTVPLKLSGHLGLTMRSGTYSIPAVSEDGVISESEKINNKDEIVTLVSFAPEGKIIIKVESTENQYLINPSQLILVKTPNPLPYETLQLGSKCRIAKDAQDISGEKVFKDENDVGIVTVECVDAAGILISNDRTGATSHVDKEILIPLQKYETLLDVKDIQGNFQLNKDSIQKWVDAILSHKLGEEGTCYSKLNVGSDLFDLVTSAISTFEPDFTTGTDVEKQKKYLAGLVAPLELRVTVCKAIANFWSKYLKDPQNNLTQNPYFLNGSGLKNRLTKELELTLYEKIEKECFGDKSEADLNALCNWTDSFGTIKGKIEEECKAMGLEVPETIKAFLTEFQAIAEYEGSNLIITSDGAITSTQYIKVGDMVYKYGKIDPCDDIPAFLGLSEVCKRAHHLYPTLKALNHDVGFLYRPGQKLLWAADQLKTRKNSASNEQKIADLTELVNKLMAGKELVSLEKEGGRLLTLEGEIKEMKKKYDACVVKQSETEEALQRVRFRLNVKIKRVNGQLQDSIKASSEAGGALGDYKDRSKHKLCRRSKSKSNSNKMATLSEISTGRRLLECQETGNAARI